jgi:predicted dehydrogenase
MEDAHRPIAIGIIGCGQAALRGHLPALRHVSGGTVIAVADLDAQRLQRAAEQFGIPRVYHDATQLLRDSDVEVVAVCVPARFHVEVASAALDAGKHVLVEKPLALSLSECDQLVRRAGQSHVASTVGFNMRWHRLVRQARAMIQRGELGAIHMIRTVMTREGHDADAAPEWRKRREFGGGVLVEASIHEFDLWRFLLNSEVEEIFALTRSERCDDDMGSIVARMANGALAATSIVQRTGSKYEVDVFGESGRLQVSCLQFDGLHFLPASRRPGDPWVRLHGLRHTLQELPRALFRRSGLSDYAASFVSEWQHLVDCVRFGRQPECTFVDGQRATEVALAAVRSASLGQPVRIAEAPDHLPTA